MGGTITELDWEIISDIEANTKHSIIAGGYVRDTLLNKSFSDIDIYIHKSELEGAEFPTWLSKYEFKSDSSYEGCMFNSYKTKHGNANIIITKDEPEVHVRESFDIGLCMVWQEINTGRVVKTPEFEYDRDNKCISVHIKNLIESQVRHCFTKHVPKLLMKYKDYDVRVVYA